MKKKKVFIPVESIFDEYTGTYLPKSGKSENVIEKELYVFTKEELTEAFRNRHGELCTAITEMQEKYDENGYDCSPVIKLQRIDNNISAAFKIWRDIFIKERDNNLNNRTGEKTMIDY